MRGFIGLTKRNILIYFKDFQSVIFSVLTSFIVFGLYMLFLKGTYLDYFDGALLGLEGLVAPEDIESLVNGILLAGIMGSALITVPYNCLTTIVKDREHKIDYDISATPIKRSQIILSYFTAASTCSFIMVSAILTIGLLVLNGMGDIHISAASLVMLYGMNIVGSVSTTAFCMIIMLFFKSSGASGAFFGMLSAAAGFIIGAYIPTAQFSDAMQTVCNIFPATHVTVIIKELLLGGLLNHIDEGIGGLDDGIFVETIRNNFSFEAFMGNGTISNMNSLLYIGAVAVVCIVIMVLLYSKTYKRK